MIDACIAAGVARLVHTSSVVAVGLSTNGQPCDETATWNFESEGLIDAYAITKHQAEEVVHGARERLDCVIVNPTYMFGPRDARPSSGKLIVDIVRAQGAGLDARLQQLRRRARCRARHDRGVAARPARRALHPRRPRHDVRRRDSRRSRASRACKPPRFRIAEARSRRIVGAVGRLRRATGREPIVNSTQIRYAYTDQFRFKSDKAARELGYTLRSARAARIRDAIGWFRAHGMLWAPRGALRS